MFELKIKTLGNNNQYALLVEECDTVLSVKKRIEDELKLGEVAKLIHAGKILENEESIGVCNHQSFVVVMLKKVAVAQPTATTAKDAQVPTTASSSSTAASTPAPSGPIQDGNPPPTPTLSDHAEKMALQFKAQMNRAFFDVLESKLADSQPDYEWVVRLFAEIRDRIANITPNRQDLKAEVHEKMDVELFDQMLRNNAYNSEDLFKLVHYVFGRIGALEAPARGETTNAIVTELDTVIRAPGCTFASFVPLFLRHSHSKLDEIESDLAAFRQDMRTRATAAR